MGSLYIHICCLCTLGLLLSTSVFSSPRYRSRNHSSSKFDQKQSGDYNFQVHLKDFHIIAILGDDPWSAYGDYDYNYDYSDLTVKPSLPLTTISPSQETTNATEEQKPSESESQTPTTLTLSEISEPQQNNENSTIIVLQNSTKLENFTLDGKGKPTESPVTNISIVPIKNLEESLYNDHRLPLGEIMHYRKCSEGFARDKQGRCRRIIRRTPQISFGISHLASSLASRFRQVAAKEESP